MSDVRRIGLPMQKAADYLGISIVTLRRWADDGHIECFRTPGNQRRFPQEELDKFLETLRSDKS